jgi:hypothetical protein
LREIVDGERQAAKTANLKKEILQDKDFLHELKEALAIEV